MPGAAIRLPAATFLQSERAGKPSKGSAFLKMYILHEDLAGKIQGMQPFACAW
jgi:hypothetical protein